jgi:hypothetical protein
MRKITKAGAAAIALAIGFGLAGCEQEKPKGPAEKIGAKIDGAAREVKEEAREAKEEIEDEIDDAKEELDEKH